MTRSLLKTATLLMLLSMFFSVYAQEQKKEAPKIEITEVKPEVSENEEIATLNGKAYTRKDLRDDLLNFLPAKMRFFKPDDVVLSQNISSFEDIIKDTMTMKLLFPEMDSIIAKLIEKQKSEPKKEQSDEPEFEGAPRDIEKQIELVKLNTKLDYYVNHYILEKAKKVSDEDIKNYYEQNKEQYLQPFSFKIRQIYLSTYKPYTVQQGDTFESIAEKISKSKDMVSFIITDDDQKKPRWVDPKNRDKEIFKELEPGEKLLVPMSPEDKTKIKDKILSIQKELKAGADFVKLAEKYSESNNPTEEIGPVVPKNKPIIPEIEEAVKKTKVGDVSEIMQTKHGFSILQVTEKNDEKYRSLEEIKDNISTVLLQESRKRVFFDVLNNAIKNNPKIKFNKEILLAEKTKPEDVIYQTGDFKFTVEKFQKDVPAEEQAKAKTLDEKIELLHRSYDGRKEVLIVLADSENFTEKDEYKKTLNSNIARTVIPQYIDGIIKDKIEKDDTKLKAFYEKNKEKFTKQKEMELRQIGLKIADDLSKLSSQEKDQRVNEIKKKLENIKSQVKDVDSFETLAAKYSDEKDLKDKGGMVGKVNINYRGGFNGVLDKLKEGTVSEPVEVGNYVYILMATSIRDEHIPPIEEIKGQVEKIYTAEEDKRLRNEFSDEILKKNNFVLSSVLFPKDKK